MSIPILNLRKENAKRYQKIKRNLTDWHKFLAPRASNIFATLTGSWKVHIGDRSYGREFPIEMGRSVCDAVWLDDVAATYTYLLLAGEYPGRYAKGPLLRSLYFFLLSTREIGILSTRGIGIKGSTRTWWTSETFTGDLMPLNKIILNRYV